MGQKGSTPILLVIILIVALAAFIYLRFNQPIFPTKTTSNSGNPYQDLKVGLKKAFEK